MTGPAVVEGVVILTTDAEGNPCRVPVPQGYTVDQAVEILTDSAVGHTVVRVIKPATDEQEGAA